jgi:hypothetical protein
MGDEAACSIRLGGRTLAGKAYLETDFLLFRGDERLKIAFKDVSAVSEAGGRLLVEFSGGKAELELGSAAAKWERKIRNPPSRSQKLGLKAGARVRLEGLFDDAFRQELADAQVVAAGPREKADLIFLAAATTADLERVPKLAKGLKPAGALWIVYPKGIKTIREIEVIEAGRSAGLKDTKVASFSSTHTALRFVIPVNAR